MRYVDGFVLVVPKKNLPAYREMAEQASKIWKKYGALEYVESVGEDLNPNVPADVPEDMKGIPFPQMAGAKSDEAVVFSYILYNSRQHRDEVNAKVMQDPLMTAPIQPMPFDMKRMSYGGYKIIVGF